MTKISEHGVREFPSDGELAETLQQAVIATMNDSFALHTQMGDWQKNADPLTLAPNIACMVEIQEHGQPCGLFITTFSPALINKVLTKFGVPHADNRAVIDDALETITNMMYGMIKSSLNRQGHHIEAYLPTAIDQNNAVLRDHQRQEKLLVSFVADGQKCQVGLSLAKTDIMVSP